MAVQQRRKEHEKNIFETLHNEIKCASSIKESNFMGLFFSLFFGKNRSQFSNFLTVRAEEEEFLTTSLFFYSFISHLNPLIHEVFVSFFAIEVIRCLHKANACLNRSGKTLNCLRPLSYILYHTMKYTFCKDICRILGIS